MQSPNGNMRAQALSIDKPIGQPYAEFVCYLARILSMFAANLLGALLRGNKSRRAGAADFAIKGQRRSTMTSRWAGLAVCLLIAIAGLSLSTGCDPCSSCSTTGKKPTASPTPAPNACLPSSSSGGTGPGEECNCLSSAGKLGRRCEPALTSYRLKPAVALVRVVRRLQLRRGTLQTLAPPTPRPARRYASATTPMFT